MKRFCILGLGRSGWSLSQYLHACHTYQTSDIQIRNDVGADQNLQQNHSTNSKTALCEKEYECVVWDDQKEKRDAAEQAGWTLWDDGFDWTDAICIVSPGISEHPIMRHASAHHRPIICDIQLFHMLFPYVKKIGITGSNGKTTTCALIHHGLSKHQYSCVLAGNMGVPIFSTLQNGFPPDAIYILELSSYQLELSSELCLDVAIILNLFPHHLERHGTMKQYQQIKERILQGARVGWIPNTWPTEPNTLPDALPNTLPHTTPTQKRDLNGIIHRWSQNHLVGYDLPCDLDSAHNRDNVAATVAVLQSLGCHKTDVFMDFKGLEHRQELVAHINHVRYCNDSKATNPHAVAKAIQAYSDGPIFWIGGGVLQTDDLDILDSLVPYISCGFMIGQAGKRYAEWLRSHGKPAEVCDLLETAVAKAHAVALSAVPNEKSCATVLLSPGCASFDQFRDFEHRGQVFKQCVQDCVAGSGLSGLAV